MIVLPPTVHLILDIAGGVGLVYALVMLIVAWRLWLRWAMTDDWQVIDVSSTMGDETVTHIDMQRFSDRRRRRVYIGYGDEFMKRWRNAPYSNLPAMTRELLADERFQEMSAEYSMPRPINSVRDLLYELEATTPVTQKAAPIPLEKDEGG